MSIKIFQKKFCVLTVMAVALFTLVYSDEARATDDQVAKDTADVIFDTALIVEDSRLSEVRGMALDLELLGVALFDAVSLNNSANGTVSGGNVINQGAFSDSSGLSTIIQNSGNNVQIQSATILNLSID